MNEILITGASSGIGLATAIKAAKDGWRVIACGRNQQRLDELASQHENIRTLAFDITDENACKIVLGKLSPDVVLLNAGTCEYVDVDDWRPAMFKRVFDANFFSVVYCIEALLPNLKAGNQIVFVDSLARLLPFTKSQAYGASKAALFYLAKTMDVDLKEKGIVVKTASPGFVKTPLTDKNTFDMPMSITADEAAVSILKIINGKSRTGYFPTVFALIVRALGSILPMSLQVKLCGFLATSAANQEASKA
ncbi:short-chain dehydrogenase [Tenacibaculum sp. KUL113]|uniref:SDR family NAD(P)-dependent oxidoreductase n=1 Tax=Alteromonas sp. KUL150 TaxID=2480805 RepID=UPI0012E67F92|nr:SDR family NAD(P)-dependent oxidoreductase [Alteromonas sp. KUL150]GFD72391.1 short-chain dehydrogenase [Tenacibaculum sp. KUL113]GFD85818.1 short-chain dehydrogenase [Alteromonas sp. KUL150]